MSVINELPGEFKVRVAIKQDKFSFPMHKRKHAVRAAALAWAYTWGTILAHGTKQQTQTVPGDILLLGVYFRVLSFAIRGAIFLFVLHFLFFLLIHRFLPLLNQESEADPWRIA